MLGLEPWAARDLEESARLPRFDSFEGYLVMVYFGIGGASRSPYEPIEVRMLISGCYIVTVHREPCDILEPLRDLRDRPEAPEGFAVYKVLDALTDSFFPALEEVDDEIDELEGRSAIALTDAAAGSVALKKGSSDAEDRHPATGPARPHERADHRVSRLRRRSDDFRDIYDRMVSVSDLIDSSRDLLTGAQDVYLSSVTERLTLVATIFLPLTFLTGFFGMNFGWMVGHIDTFKSFMLLGIGGIGGPDRGPPVLFWRAGYIGPQSAATIEGHNQGTIGFDVVVSWRKWQAEVPGRPRKTTGKTCMCGLSRVRPRRLVNS